MESQVDWRRPAGRPDALFGSGARPVEKALALAGAAGAVVVVLGVVAATDSDIWAVWQYVLAAVLVADLAGGVVANGLNSAKRDHFSPEPDVAEPASARLVRRHVLFTALHLQPVLIALLFPGPGLWWGVLWYLVTLAAVVAVRRSPLYLQRPVALLACTLVAVTGPLVPAPYGFWWLPVILVLKLALAHAVQEEPYRPRESGEHPGTRASR
ncbi:hypothetical protein [Naasia sp. SYSU D00948]|uniref:hypothetical protein n=1 Tax=Naasia sp. SYSU D00948 TaxID=2817379 RepID=UPI001B30A522|nr:hypothetical protein [Naasia sp. SYSU D00948]